MDEEIELEIIDLRESIKELAKARDKLYFPVEFSQSLNTIIQHCDMRAERMREKKRNQVVK